MRAGDRVVCNQRGSLPMRIAVFWVLVGFSASWMPARGEEAETGLSLEPPRIELAGAEARQQLLVTYRQGKRERDVTHAATFTASEPGIALVTADGVVKAVADGTTRITATIDGMSVSTEVQVKRAAESLAPHFARDVVPLLTRLGCNSGACHGKQNGQRGFQLSVFGYDPRADYLALVQEGRGRRLFPAAPERSLLLLKAINQVPHGGGERLLVDSPEYRRLLRWIELGMPWGADDASSVSAITVSPAQRVLVPGEQQQLMVTAEYADGRRRDVTHEAIFHSNDETIATVDRAGLVTTTELTGESAIVVRYGEHVAASLITLPMQSGDRLKGGLASWDRSNMVDRLVAEKWERLGVVPSPAADDATFLRRVHLDLIGRLPTPEETVHFLNDQQRDKRLRLIDDLLERPEYADFWALRWADLLRINREELGPKAAFQYHAWLRDAWRKNLPYDQFLRELLAARGNTERNWAANFYRTFKEPNELTVAVSQVFLGVRLECARCHHHPYEKWSQDDFYGFAALFPRVTRKPAGPTAFEVYVAESGQVTHPKTGAAMQPRVLLGEPLAASEPRDPRQELVDWMTTQDNPWVARTLVNRLWAHLLGRGLVEPVDDMRETNPASNEPLLAALATDFIEGGYDVRRLLRLIVSSQTYALSSTPNETNARDSRYHSRAYRKPLSAEVLLDAICDVTGEAELFVGMPPGTRAVQLWDHRLPSTFLDTFGRPLRKTVCQCERGSEATLGQVLHLLNSSGVNDKISSPTGRAAKLAASDLTVDELIDQLYLAAYSRFPSSEERLVARGVFEQPGGTRRQATEDLLWALLNSAEFVLNH